MHSDSRVQDYDHIAQIDQIVLIEWMKAFISDVVSLSQNINRTPDKHFKIQLFPIHSIISVKHFPDDL
jgi:hypothetical protein